MNRPSRKPDSLKHSTGISEPTSSRSGFSPASAFAQAAYSRKGGPGLKTSLNAYSFNLQLRAGAVGSGSELTLFDVLDFCSQHRFDAIDPTGYFFPGYPDVPSDAYLSEFSKRTSDLGLDISGTGIRNNFASSDMASRVADIELARKWIEVADKLGAPVIRLFAGHEDKGVDREEVYKWMADDLRICAEYGRQHGVLIGVQHHGDFLKTADQTIRLVEMVHSDWLGVIVDTGYFHTDPYNEIAAVVPYAVNFQVKTSPYGKNSPVPLDLDRFVGIIRNAGYRGYLPIETLTPDGGTSDPLNEVPPFLAKVKAAIDRSG